MAKTRELKIVIAGDADKLDRETRKAVASLDKFSKKTKATADDTARSFTLINKAAEKSSAKLKMTLAGGGLAAGAALSAGLLAALDVGRATDKLAAQLGASGKYAASLGKIAGRLYANAYGESIGQVNEALKRVLQDGLLPEDATNAQIEGITAKVLDLSTAFDQELGGSTRAVSALMRNNLAGSASQALDIVTRGFQQGVDKSEDYVDTLNEYSPLFKRLGLDGAQATGLLSQGLKGGARDADTVADALKEFQIRSTDASTASADGYKLLGLNAKEMTAEIAKGGPAAEKGLGTVLKRLRETEDPVKRNAAAVALFGTKAEDLGEALFSLDPTSAEAALGKVTGAAKEMGDTLNDNAATRLEAFQRKAKTAIVDVLGGQAVPAVEKFIDEMKSGTGAGGDFADTMQDIWRGARPIVTWIGRATKNVAEFGEQHPKLAKLAAGIVGVGLAVKALRFVSAATGFTHLLKAGSAATRGLKRIFASGGTAAGEAAAANAASGFTASSGKIRSAGRAAGRTAGKGFVSGMVVGTAMLLPDIKRKLESIDVGKINLGDLLFIPLSPQWIAEKSAGALRGLFNTLKDAAGDGEGRASRAVSSFMSGAAKGAAGGLMGADGALAPIAAASGLRVSSGKRAAGGRTKSGGVSYHGSGEAVDLAGSPGAMLSGFRKLKSRFGSRLAELIYTPGGVGIKNGRPHRYTGAVAADHNDHVHVALDLGKPGPGIGDGPGRRDPFTGDGYGKSQIMNLWTRQGGSATVANLAASVALAESGGNPSAKNVNSNGSIDRGLWQINSIHGGLSTFDPSANAKAAVKISSGGRNWRPWVAFTNGAYRRFLGVPGTSRSGSSSSGGSGSARASSANTERTGSRIVNSVSASFTGGRGGITSLLRTATGRERVIGEKDTEFGQAERRFGQTDEDLGTAGGRAQRTSELAELRKLKAAQLKRQQQRLTALTAAVRKYDGLIKALRAKLKGKNAAKGAAAVRIRKRIRDFEDKRIELAAEARSLGSQIEDTKLDLGDIDKDAAEVAATPDTAAEEGPSTADNVSQRLSDIDLQQRAGMIDSANASAWKAQVLNQALGGAFGAIDERQRWELMAQLREATQESTEATSNLAQALAENTASNQALLAAHNGIAAITSREAIRAMTDVMSGQMGQGVAARGRMPGSGTQWRL
jgi:phage-related minor tail protein